MILPQITPDELRVLVQMLQAVSGFAQSRTDSAKAEVVDELRQIKSIVSKVQDEQARGSDLDVLLGAVRREIAQPREGEVQRSDLDVLLGAIRREIALSKQDGVQRTDMDLLQGALQREFVAIGNLIREARNDFAVYLQIHHQALMAKLAQPHAADSQAAGPAKLELPPLRRRPARTWGAPPEGLEASEHGLVVPRCSLGPLGGEVTSLCNGVAFLGDLVAAATREGHATRLTLWNMEDGRPLVLDETRDALAREGLTAAASAEVALVHSRDMKPSAVLDSGRLRTTAWTDAGPHTAIRLAPDGRHVFAGRQSWEGTHVAERAVTDGSAVRQFAFSQGDPVQAVDVSLDGRVVVAAGMKTLRAWDRGTGRTLLDAAGAVQPQVAADAAGATVVVAGGASGTRPTDVRAHRTDTGAVLWSVSGLPGSVDWLVVGACDRVVVVVTREVNPDRIHVYVLDHETGRERDRWSLTAPPGLRSFAIQRSVTNGTSDLLAFVLGDRVVVLEIAAPTRS